MWLTRSLRVIGANSGGGGLEVDASVPESGRLSAATMLGVTNALSANNTANRGAMDNPFLRHESCGAHSSAFPVCCDLSCSGNVVICFIGLSFFLLGELRTPYSGNHRASVKLLKV